MALKFINILDLKELLLNTFSGSVEIFGFIAVILISMGAGAYRMPTEVYLVLLVLFTVIMSGYVGGLYLLALLIGSIVSFFSIARIVTR